MRLRRTVRGEFDLIARLVARLPAGEGVTVGPGDDAAVLRPTPDLELVATTDTFVEGVHWDPSWLAPEEVGVRLAAANLSDLAAMAATPRWALVSLGVAAEPDEAALEATQSGLARTLARYGAAIVGGNVTRTRGAAWWSVTLLGEVAKGAAWTRFGARPGDLLAVTGRPGRAGAAIAIGSEAQRVAFTAPAADPLRRSYASPAIRLAFARRAAATGAVTAAIDLSDGLAGDLTHLCHASGVGARLEEQAMPEDRALIEAARLLSFQKALGGRWTRLRARWASFKAPPQRLALAVRALRFGASDDYELLMAVDPDQRRALVEVAQAERTPLTFVGSLTDEPDRIRLQTLEGDRPLAVKGWDHLVARAPGARPAARVRRRTQR